MSIKFAAGIPGTGGPTLAMLATVFLTIATIPGYPNTPPRIPDKPKP